MSNLIETRTAIVATVWETTKLVGALARTRLLLEQLDFPAPKRLVDQPIVRQIQTFFRLSEEGYLAARHETKENAPAILAQFQELSQSHGPSNNRLLTDPSPAEFHYLVVWGTLAVLSQACEVNFAQFSPPLDNDDLGQVEEEHTFWHQPLTPPERVWETMADIHQQTKNALTDNTALPHEQNLRLGHFFAATFAILSKLRS